MLGNEGERLKRVVVCTPRKEYARASNLEEHNVGGLGDPKLVPVWKPCSGKASGCFGIHSQGYKSLQSRFYPVLGQ